MRRRRDVPRVAGDQALASALRRRLMAGWGSRLAVASLMLGRLAHASPAPGRFAAVSPEARLAFPRDHGSHPEFRIEWWYLTGWLRRGGTDIGLQITFFRINTGHQRDNPSRFAARQLLFAHAALAIPERSRLLVAERVAREGFGLAEASPTDTDLRIGDWRLSRDGGDCYQAHISDRALSIDLSLRAQRPPLLQGEQGYSRKGPQPSQASHYYSRPRLEASGDIGFDLAASPRLAVKRPAQGTVWFDHEWSSELLDGRAQGWDWVGLHLDDDSALMAFRIRGQDGSVLWSDRRWVDSRGQPIEGLRQATGDLAAPSPPGAAAATFTPIRLWRSPRTGAAWPVEMRLTIGQRTLDLKPLFDDQELDSTLSTGTVYWEGAVRVIEHGQMIGRGYLELTGYAGALKL